MIRSTTPIGAKGRGRQLSHREAMEQTSEEEVKTTGKVARTLRRPMATALARDSASDLM